MGNVGKAAVVVALLLVAPDGMAAAGAGVELLLPAGWIAGEGDPTGGGADLFRGSLAI